ncbi:MAG: hypothetical protein LUO89_11250 [Methanothrix sp.]|nr:hypothetical protein [Methanothrix sp.]
MKLAARAMSEAGLPYYQVTGGPLQAPLTMGWQIADENGITVAVANDPVIADMITLVELLVEADAAYHILERYGDGYLQMSERHFGQLHGLLLRFENSFRPRKSP